MNGKYRCKWFLGDQLGVGDSLCWTVLRFVTFSDNVMSWLSWPHFKVDFLRSLVLVSNMAILDQVGSCHIFHILSLSPNRSLFIISNRWVLSFIYTNDGKYQNKPYSWLHALVSACDTLSKSQYSLLKLITRKTWIVNLKNPRKLLKSIAVSND